MRSVICHGPRDLRLEQRELPALNPQQIQVQVAYGGICGSDLHYAQHGGFGTVRIKEPIALGHEVSGIVQTVGATCKAWPWASASPSRPHALAATAAFARRASTTTA